MNSHLNIFKTYSKTSRVYQLENDLTRAFAICLQEDSLFFHEVLKTILKETEYFDILFEDIERKTEITIDIQKKASLITGYSHMFAVSLSENPLSPTVFWEQNNIVNYDPVCDLVISVDNVAIIVEAKRDNVNCAAQLYNQVYNICKSESLNNDLRELITPVDLNWPMLMEIAVKIFSFEVSNGNRNRFLGDFISLVRLHNFRWIPEPPMIALSHDDQKAILRRIQSAANELGKREQITNLNNRTGFEFPKLWAKELIFDVHEDGDLIAVIYPANTKEQGRFIFDKEPSFKKEVTVNGKLYPISKAYHIKFSSQKYFTGLWFTDNDISSPIYTKKNFDNYSGRKKRTEHWRNIESFFDYSFKEEFNWKDKCLWHEKVINTNRNQFDLSMGYELCIRIPFAELKNLDRQKSDLSKLVELLYSIYNSFLELID